jgi:predicted ATPase
MRLLELQVPTGDGWPWTVPAIAALAASPALKLSTVTLFVGENGSGKSTLLEAVARQAALPTIGSEEAERDPTLSHLDAFSSRLKLRWSTKSGRGFFLRAEDFFAYSRRLQVLGREMQVLADGYEAELRHSEGQNLLRDSGLKKARGMALAP